MIKTHKNIDQAVILSYLTPELENLKALLKGLHLRKSLIALIFLEKIIENELKRF